MNIKKSILSSCKKSLKPKKPFGEKKTYGLLFLVHMFDAKMTVEALARGAIELNPFFQKHILLDGIYLYRDNHPLQFFGFDNISFQECLAVSPYIVGDIDTPVTNFILEE